MQRSRIFYCYLSAAVGLFFNLLLSVFKITIGSSFGVISVVADGFNNLSDLGSNIVSLIGFRISATPPDEEHPYGHERAEHITTLIVVIVIFMLCSELFQSAILKIITPEDINYPPLLLFILIGSILVKTFLYFFNSHLAKTTDSTVLKATALDCLTDILSTAFVLFSIGFSHYTSYNIDAYVALGLSIFVVLSASKIFKESFSQLLGKDVDISFKENLTMRLLKYKGVLGVHDLMIHNYGCRDCNNLIASVHLEMDENLSLRESHVLVEQIVLDMKNDIRLVIQQEPASAKSDKQD